MDLLIFISCLIGFLAVIGTNIGMFLWSRSETNAQISAMRSDVNAQISGMRSDVNAQISGMREEMKDFHGRLCAIEERSRGLPVTKKEN